MKTKRAIGSTIMTLVMAMMFVLGRIGIRENVSAANTGDEAWTCTFDADSPEEKILPRRAIQNSTGIYIKWTASFGGNLSEIWVIPYGTRTRTSPLVPAGTMTGGTAAYVMSGPGQYVIPNYSYELGMTYVTVGMKAKTGYGTAIGVWSSDSTRNYTVLH